MDYSKPKVLIDLEEYEFLISCQIVEVATKPPLGLTPRCIQFEIRIADIRSAISRYEEAQFPVPIEWRDELNQLLAIQNLKAFYCPIKT